MKKENSRFIILIFIIVAVIIFIVYYDFIVDKKSLPPATVENYSQVNLGQTSSGRIISVTEGIKHSVPLNEIIGGGPSKDGIPSIDEPKFVSFDEADEFLTNDSFGIALAIGDAARFYPYNILVWHEIVNDKIDDKRYLVTYCPLCASGIVFNPIVNNKQVEFGTSGKLWNSNLVMYDRLTDSWWSQVLGEAIVGEMTGSQLEIIPSDITSYSKFKENYPEGQVLSKETGKIRNYDEDPYGDYYIREGLISRVNNEDDRLRQKDFVYGIIIEGKAKAYLKDAIVQEGVIEDEFGGTKFLIEYNPKLDTPIIYEELEDGSRVRVNPFPNFWFSWVAAHPKTELYK